MKIKITLTMSVEEEVDPADFRNDDGSQMTYEEVKETLEGEDWETLTSQYDFSEDSRKVEVS